MNTSQADINIKPNKRAFVTTRIFATVAGSLLAVVFVIVLAVAISWWILLALILVAGGTIYDVADAFVAWNKQHYRLESGKVYFDEGHLFSDRKTELRYENITSVRVIKPFIEYNIFGTGKIKIEAAGSKTAAVTFRSIDDPYQVFEDIKRILAKQTFSLTYDSVLSQKKPSPLAVMLQMIGGLIVLLFFVLTNIGAVAGASSILFDFPVFVPVLFGFVLLAGFTTYAVVAYRDQVRRTYSVYNDVIHYSKGYLTKQEAFIPAANLANTELTQNFVGKLLSLQDVVVSCQGQGGKINFANLRHGEDMQKAINQLINNRKKLFKQADEAVEKVAAKTAESDQAANLPSRILASPTPEVDDVSAQDYQMNLKRAMMAAWPAIIFLPVFAIVALQIIIMVKRTVYRLTDGGVASYYSFLSTKNVELSRDKITGLVIRRNPIDRWLKTCSVEFWSIGSGVVVRMQYIDYSDDLVATMKAKAGIPEDEELEVVQPQFGVGVLIKANISSVVMFGLLMVVSVVLAAIISAWFYATTVVIVATIGIIFAVLARRYKRTYLRLGRYTTSLQIGVLFRKKYWALNQNIKRVSLTKYPLTNVGTVRFDIAGEHPVSDSNGKGPGLAPNQFSVPYIAGVADELDDKTAKYDAILSSNPTASQYQKLLTSYPLSVQKAKSRPQFKNQLLVMIPMHLIIFPLLAVLPLSVFLSWYWIRRVSYICTKDRIIKRWGVVYRKQTSIIFNKLDYTENGQGFANKVFKNGKVYLYTAGSSDVELTLDDMPDYIEFHQLMASVRR